MAGHIQSSSSVEHETPGYLVNASLETMGSIELDPCGYRHVAYGSRIGAVNFYLPINGLEQDWSPYKTIFVNPPFGRSYLWKEGPIRNKAFNIKSWQSVECLTPKQFKERYNNNNKIQTTEPHPWAAERQSIADWIAKVDKNWHKYPETQTCLLIPAATDTKAWHEHIFPMHRVCFLKGRVKFVGAKTGCPMAMAMVYFGTQIKRFNEVFSKLGAIR